MNTEKLVIPLTDTVSLVAEADIGAHVMPYKEIYVGIEVDGEWKQDLAVIREQYHYDQNNYLNVVADHGKYEVIVYENDGKETFEWSFSIHESEEE